MILFVFTMLYLANGQNNTSFQKLDWLAGKWHFATDKTIFVEAWTKVSEKTFEGLVFSVKKENNDTTFSETLRLVEMSGDIFYLPYVKHNPYPVAFKLIPDSAGSLVFENTNHDFPQRISYIFKDKNIFTARVEGMEKGKMRAFELLYKRQD